MNGGRRRWSAWRAAWVALAVGHALLVGLTLGLWLRSYWWVDAAEIGVRAGAVGAVTESVRVESMRGRVMAYVPGYMMFHSDWPFPEGASWQPPAISEGCEWGVRWSHAWVATAERPTRFDLDAAWRWWDVKRLPGDGSVGYFGVVIPYGGVAAVLGSLWLPAWVRRFRAWRRRRAGRCGVCGYDLRASVGRCPECGVHEPSVLAVRSGR